MAVADDSYSVKQLKEMAPNTPSLINIERFFATDFSDQQQLIERAVDYCALKLAENRHLKQSRSEDELTIDIIEILLGMGYDATHDTQVGGHVDILVRGKRDFLWIGECKIHGAYDWLLQGYQQLDTRYSTGNPGQDTGEILIFVFNARLDEVVAKWMEHLKNSRADVAVEVSPSDNLVHYSTHPHPGTGRPFRVRHKPISLYWKPDDKGKA